MKIRYKLLSILAVFAAFYFFPLNILPFKNPVFESLALTQWYAREHVLLCLVPAFFIAGAIAVFVKQASVVKYFGAKAKKILAYTVASVSGSILSVCSCTVLPLFSSIYKRGAGLGPAIAFLYSGPAINILAVILTAKVLGWQIGLARAVGAVIFSVVAGLAMHFIFIKEEKARHADASFIFSEEKEPRPLWKEALYFISMAAVLVFANISKPQSGAGLWPVIFKFKWHLALIFLFSLIVMAFKWFTKKELKGWVKASGHFAAQIMPLLFLGVLAAGLLLGRPGQEGIIPSMFVGSLVGGNSLFANFFASIAGAFMYFATLTEVPILKGLIGAGMGKGPALALLLAGPSLSLPSMLVIKSVLGAKKTIIYVSIVVAMATLSGVIFGKLTG